MANNIEAYTKTDFEFYPTPKSLVEKMISEIDLGKVEAVLEPSAGKGNIADVIVKRLESMNYYITEEKAKAYIDCVEIDENLQHILVGKGYRVVHDDFLTFHTQKRYDLIVMNPPFSNGDEHLMKALELIKDGGTVVCLLNAETIRNKCTNLRKLLFSKLTEMNANITYINDAFTGSERKTGVEIALVTVKAPEVERESFIFENLKKKAYEEYSGECNDLVAGDFIDQIIKRFEIECEAGIRLINEYNALKPHILREIEANNYTSPIIELNVGKNGCSVNKYVELVRKKYWEALFANKKFTGKLTSDLHRELMEKVRELSDYDFSKYNISKIQIEILSKVNQGVNDAILKLFDKLSAQYSWYPECSNNIHYYNGWASNSAHKINSKVIIPLNEAFSAYSFNKGELDVFRICEVLQDLEKSLSYLDTGIVDDTYSLADRIRTHSEAGITKNIPLKYFSVTFYKKGTCHIKFLNLDLLEKLNIYGSQKKNWLPPSYGKKAYNNMTEEEKAVIDDFQGKNLYDAVIKRRDYYLDFTAPQQFMIEGV